MPLPSDEQLVKTAQELVSQFQAIFGKHPGFRPAHAKGILLNGTFTPTSIASTLSSAPHFNTATTPILVRFSNSTGLPNNPDTDPNADPRGIAIRFQLPPSADGKRVHTDIISHSTPFFPTRTGAEFLDFLHALVGGTIGEYLENHPAAKAFVTAPKPAPSSYAREQYFSVTAFKLVSSSGRETFIRYRIVPVLGVETLSAEALSAQEPEYLQKEIKEHLENGSVEFRLVAQVAEESDVTDDNTVHWPEDREILELGTVRVEGLESDGAAKSKDLIFDPIPRVQGVEPSEDPLLELRAAVYLISGRERRAA